MIRAQDVRKPPRQVSPSGITTLKGLEAKGGKANLQAYKDGAGRWTIGFGHTGDDVYEGVSCTPEAAEHLLDTDLDTVENAICRHLPYRQLSQHQFDALAIMLFNAGVGAMYQPHFAAALETDPVTGKLKFDEIAAQFPKWIYITNPNTHKKEKSRGLINRRAAEVAIWNTPDLPQVDAPVMPLAIAPPVSRVRDMAPRPLVALPVIESQAQPLPPPSTVPGSAGGKSLIVTVGSVVVATGGEIVKQVQSLVADLQQIKSSTDALGKMGHIAAIAMGTVVIGVAVYTYWVRHHEVTAG